MKNLKEIYDKGFCPVCGFNFHKYNNENAWKNLDGVYRPSYEYCGCGIQFGYHDYQHGESEDGRIKIYSNWRKQWMEKGMLWNGEEQAPGYWNPPFQLKNIGIETDENGKMKNS